MTRLRTLIFWSHLVTAVFVGIVVAIMSATGVALMYQKPVQYWADTRHFRAAPPADGVTRLPLASVLDPVRRASAEPPMTVVLRRDPTAPMGVTAGARTLYVNPYDATIYGEGEGAGWRSFFSTMTAWHRYLTRNPERRTLGRAITGACNLGFLFLVVSGFYLWWPSSLQWSRIRSVLLFRRAATAKARDFNWHNVIGFWSAIPLAVIVAGGAVISYPWATGLVYRAFGEQPPAPAAGSAAGARGPRVAQPRGPSFAADAAAEAAIAHASAVEPNWQMLSVRLADRAAAPITVTVDAGNGGQPQLRGTLTVSQRSDVPPTWEPFSSQSPGRRARSWLRFLHTGEAAGLAGQTMAGLVSAGAVVLVYTGFALAWRRMRQSVVGNRSRRRAQTSRAA